MGASGYDVSSFLSNADQEYIALENILRSMCLNYEQEKGTLHNTLIKILKWTSLTILIPIILLLFFNKRLQKHPNTMFAYLMLFDSTYLL